MSDRQEIVEGHERVAGWMAERGPVMSRYKRAAGLRLRFTVRGDAGMADLMQTARRVLGTQLDDIDIRYYGCRQDQFDA